MVKSQQVLQIPTWNRKERWQRIYYCFNIDKSAPIIIVESANDNDSQRLIYANYNNN